MKRMMLTTIAGTFAAGLALATAGDAAAQALTLRISGENPATGYDLVMAQKFADLLKEELGDDFQYELFHTQALGDENVHIQMIRTGQIDVYPMGSDAVRLDSAWAVFDMPFLFSDRETVARLLDGEIGEEFRKSMRAKADLELLAFGGEELDAVVEVRIVRSGNHDAAVGAQRARQVRDGRRGHRAHQLHVDARGDQARFERGFEHVVRNARVLADDHDRLAPFAARVRAAQGEPVRVAQAQHEIGGHRARAHGAANAVGAEVSTRHGMPAKR